MSSMLSSMLSFNYNQLKNIKAKTELNPNALEFIPENQETGNLPSNNVFVEGNLPSNNVFVEGNLPSNNVKQIEKAKYDDKHFDNLEKSFVKNNEWLFYI